MSEIEMDRNGERGREREEENEPKTMCVCAQDFLRQTIIIYFVNFTFGPKKQQQHQKHHQIPHNFQNQYYARKFGFHVNFIWLGVVIIYSIVIVLYCF